jgi:perosamine synthetase
MGSWLYEMVDLGYNYRLSDIQCALGLTQIAKLPGWLARRRVIAHRYDLAFAPLPGVHTLRVGKDIQHGYHLYVVELDLDRFNVDRQRIFAALRAEGIGVNVHYLPVHLHPFYREALGTRPGMCPSAESAYEKILSLPLFPAMSDNDVDDVIEAMWKVTSAYANESQSAAVAGAR